MISRLNLVYQRKYMTRIDPEYNGYYVYTAIYQNSKQITCGASPAVWKDNVIYQGGIWKKGLTWVNGNYHLYENAYLLNEDVLFIEECIYIALNEGEETFGIIIFDELFIEVKWCLLEEKQLMITMDIFE